MQDIQPAASTSSVEGSHTDAESVLQDVISGLIQSHLDAPGIYAPRLISNQPGNTMGEALREELEHSNSFDISVAFVSAEAIKSLFQEFKDTSVQETTQTNRIITSTKNYFNKPSAFWELLRLKNVSGIDVRIWGENSGNSQSSNGQAFHPKGYVFARTMDGGKAYYNVYVGSSNLTQYALGIQREWNLRVSSLSDGELVQQFQDELHSQITHSIPLSDEWIKQYEEDFKRYAPPRREILESMKNRTIEPNKMQQAALQNLARLRQSGEHRAIIISATGTGKTFLSAFDVKACKPRRMLYLAHQQQILTKAMESYSQILGCDPNSLGLLSGSSKDSDKQYVFATIQTMSKPEVLQQFNPDDFDYILIDEVHHAAAATYQRVINHFSKADFMLGMTATPERTDGINIFELFDHNIAYEIRLQQALDEQMLCPFHYYGVTEYIGSSNDSETSAARLAVSEGLTSANTKQLGYEISQLATPERVRYIIDILEQYSSYYQPITGLVFCSRRDEARQLSDLFNQHVNQQAENRNYRTIAVTGETPAREREEAIQNLQDGKLDYMFTVDLFNEGIDIPAINQIVMLRATQSSIIFTQQLGRGLRKFPHKDSVTVIDFIGNYENNYLIPVALYGNTGDRDIARKNLQQHSIGLSSISFDPIAKERILHALDNADWSDMKMLTEQYRTLRFQLGRIPMLTDVYEHDPSLPCTIASKQGSYLDFVRSRERSLSRTNGKQNASFLEQLEPTTDMQNAMLKMATVLLLPGLRPHELVILDALCKFDEYGSVSPGAATLQRATPSVSHDEIIESLERQFPLANHSDSQLRSAIHVLDLSYFTAANRDRFGSCPLITATEDNRIQLNTQFSAMLADNRTFRTFFADTLRTGLINCHALFSSAASQQRAPDYGFIYGEKYALSDVMRLLGWSKELNGQNVGGYLTHRETGTMPIFVKYATSQYDDRFINPQEMCWFSKNGRSPNSPEFQWMRDGLDTPTWQDTHFIPLFVMRKEEAKETKYYYVGHVTSLGQSLSTTTSGAQDGKEVKLTVTNLHLNAPIDPDLYRHLTGEAAV